MVLRDRINRLQAVANAADRALFGQNPPFSCAPYGILSAVNRAARLLEVLTANVEAWKAREARGGRA